MNLQTAKLELIKKITELEDEDMITLMHGIIDTDNEADWWGKLTDNQCLSIRTAREQLAEGKGIPHEEIIAKYRQKYRA